MAGAPYAAGGIRTTVAATLAASEEELRGWLRPGGQRRLRAGITHVEVKSGYALTVGRRGATVRARRGADRRRHVPRRPRRAGRVRGARRRLRRARLRRRCSRACRTHVRWIDVFCERGGVRRRPVPRGPRGGRGPPGSACASTPTSSGPGPASSSPSSSAPPRPITARTSTDADLEALAASRTVATFLPATDFATRQPYPDARRAIDAGVRGRAGDEHEPRVELHDLDELLHRARRP